jgi:predicted nucleic acid-binding protein
MTGETHLIDSSAWIVYLTDQAGAEALEKFLVEKRLLVPTLVLYEVYRHLLKSIEPAEALVCMTQMETAEVVPLDHETALFAAELSLQHKLGMADAVLYATTLSRRAKLVTFDNDFRGLKDCVIL